jgi:hypothetical protein
MKNNKFIVVSYNDDQQQWFWDFVVAKSEEDAEALVCKRRPYVIGADAVSSSELSTLSFKLASTEIAQVRKDFNTLMKDT